MVKHRCNYPVNINITTYGSGKSVYCDEDDRWRCGEKFPTEQEAIRHIIEFHKVGSCISEIDDNDKTRYF